jgi:hypothetical protein
MVSPGLWKKRGKADWKMASIENRNTNDVTPKEGTRPTLVLSGQQRTLLRSLAQKSPELSRIYLGANHVLNDSSNPDALSLAAHAIRELMEKIPEYLDVPTRAQKETAKGKIREIEGFWERAIANSQCHSDGLWNGKIDSPLRKLLAKIESFIDWFRNHYPRRRDEVNQALNRMEDSGRSIPPPLQKLNVEAWMQLRDFFVFVAHHRTRPSRDEFLERLDALERFLLERLNPRTFEDFEEIDNILSEEDA